MKLLNQDIRPYKGMFLASTLLAALGCEQNMPISEDNDTPLQSLSSARIEIAGGYPSSSGTTRAEGEEEPDLDPVPQEPSRPGFCNADMLKIFYYEGSSTSAVTPTVTYQDTVTHPIAHFSGVENRDKWTTYSLKFDKKGLYNYGFGFPALAYTDALKDRLNISTGDSKITNLSLNYEYKNDADLSVPEIFFGRLNSDTAIRHGGWPAKDENVKWTSMANGCFYVYNGTTYSYTCPLGGKLYRAVSQINLTISNVSPEVVERIELYASNVPTTLTLCGNHGEYYPVTPTTDVVEAKDINQKNYKEVPNNLIGSSDIKASDYVRVASANNKSFKNETATLSAFFLPSRIGRSLCLRVYFKPKAYIKDGKEIQMKDYPLQPARSAFLTGEDAIVYYAENVDNKGNISPKYDFFKADDNVKNTYPYLNGKSIYVYNVVEDKFYSYANVRVNLSGKFDNFFADREQTDVTIEVCPTFEKEHYFDIK